MKRFALILLLAVLTAVSAKADVAPKTPYPYTQPDGTVIMLQNHGDEFDNWVTWNGREVELGADGYWHPVTNAPARRMARRAAAASRREEAALLRARARAERIGMGEKRFPVLLIGFSDLAFTTSDAVAAYTRMLNDKGYSENGGTGSAKDYFTDNSAGSFIPVFDVYGPVTVSKGYAYYGQDIGSDRSAHASEAMKEACQLLDDEIDFSVYDNDGDGYVDNVFFFFAGHSQSDGADSDHIWPHQYSTSPIVLDGKNISRYGCASEYRGASGTERSGIGTFCHEFTHALGLGDLYDANGSTNGTAVTPGEYSLMCNGASLNEGRTPANLTSLERQMLGWMDASVPLVEEGTYTQGPLSENAVPYISKADVEGEYFLYEMRDGSGWDAYLPKGLVVYHVDQSLNEIASGITAKQAWDGHYVNRYGDHPCYYPVVTDATWFLPTAWSGWVSTMAVSDITISGNNAILTVESAASARKILGVVKDVDGNPLEGAQVSIPGTQVLSGADGSFTLLIPAEEAGTSFTVTAALDGYATCVREITVVSVLREDFVLRSIGASPSADLKKFPDSGSAYGRGNTTMPKDIMGAVHWSKAELQPYAGMALETISFQYAEADPYLCEEAYVIVDKGSERILTQKVENPQPYTFNVVDVSAAGILIPADGDLFIGYALKNVNAMYPLLRRKVTGLTDGSYMSSFSLERSFWSGESNQAILVAASVYDSYFKTLSVMGFNAIDNPGRKTGYKSGDTFTFRLLETPSNRPSGVTWYYDSVLQDGGSVVLTSGAHLVEARLEYPDGSIEVLTLDLEVE